MKWIGFVAFLILLFAILVQTGFNGSYKAKDGTYKMLSATNSWGHLYNHPLWNGNGQSMVSVWGQSTVSDLTSFMSIKALSYWCGWNTDEIVGSINHLIDTANHGNFLLMNIYSEEDIANNPNLANAQIAFYRGEPDMPVAIVAAGGGYTQVVSLTEGYPIAAELHSRGYNVCVLRYRVGDELGVSGDFETRSEAAKDMAQAVKYLCDNEEMLGIDMDGYSMFGGSAGGGLITLYAFDAYGCMYEQCGLPKPSTINLIYTDRFLFYREDGSVNLEFSEKDKELAVFLIVGEGDAYGGDWVLDQKVPEMITVMGEKRVSYTKYTDYPHGAGLGVGTSAEGWIEEAIAFWETHKEGV